MIPLLLPYFFTLLRAKQFKHVIHTFIFGLVIVHFGTSQQIELNHPLQLISQSQTEQSVDMIIGNPSQASHYITVDIGDNELVKVLFRKGSKQENILKGWSLLRNHVSDYSWKYLTLEISPNDTVSINTALSSISGRPVYIDRIAINHTSPTPFILTLFKQAKWGVLIALIFLGTCIALLFYFIALSLADPKAEHWYFSLFMGAISLNSFMIVDGGMDLNICFKNPIHYLYLNDLFVNLTFISYTLFVLYFLEIKKHSESLSKYIYVQITIHILTILLCSIWVYTYDDLNTVRGSFAILYIISFLLSLGSLYWIWRVVPSWLKNPIIAGSLIWSIGSLIELNLAHGFTLIDFIIPEWSLFSFSITQIAFFPIIIGFSLAIGYKNKLRDREKYDISQQLVSQLEENKQLQLKYTEELENEVDIKSQEIIKEKERSLQSEYENKILQLESDQLISQMNPHFIFNSLNSIKYYAIAKNTSETAEYITEFAQLMRTILDHSRKKFITIGEELNFLQLYLNIEAKRFDHSFTYDISAGIDKNSLLPPMLIQPHVENAIIHGKIHQLEGGQVNVVFEPYGTRGMKIRISDNGIGRVAAKLNNENTKRNSHATQILKERIQVLNLSYQLDISIKIADLYDQQTSTGTEIVITVPQPISENQKQPII